MKIIKIAAIAALLSVPTVANAEINLGKLISTGIETVQNLTATSNFEASDLVGTWTYSSPAISFKGDNALANIGGAAAASTIESKLAPYYDKVGMQNSQLTVNDDLTFTWKIGMISLTGTIEKTKDSNLIFNFSAFGKVPIGKLDCMATKSGNVVSLTFDASALISIAQKVSSISNNSTLQSVNALVSNYKDMYIGAKMKKK